VLEVELDLAGQRVGVPADVELGELLAVEVKPELKAVGGELHLDHAWHRSGRRLRRGSQAGPASWFTLACSACCALQPAAQSAWVSCWEDSPTSIASWRRCSDASW
jgi:hypothetical protein